MKETKDQKDTPTSSIHTFPHTHTHTEMDYNYCGYSVKNDNKIINDGDEGDHSQQRGPCGACKFLRRKCVKGCVFAPYFESGDEGTAQFAAVHKVFGASNAAKMLTRIPPHHRLHAVLTLSYEALSRARDPVYGCVSHIFSLQQQVPFLSLPYFLGTYIIY